MATWTVTPSEGVTNNGDGTFVFPSNDTYCNSAYTVTYTDNGCSCQQTVTVSGKDCSNSYGPDVWDDYTCTGHEGEDIRVEGYYMVYPKTRVGCTSCEEGEPYKATTSKTVSCECLKLTDNCGDTVHVGSNGKSGSGDSIHAPHGVKVTAKSSWITGISVGSTYTGILPFSCSSYSGGGTRSGSISVERADSRDSKYCSSGTIGVSQISSPKHYCKKGGTWYEVDSCTDDCTSCY